MLKHETDKTLNELIERAKERQEKWNTITVRELPDPFTLKEVTFLGSYSYSLVSSRKRLIVKRDAISLNPLIRETPSAIARDYLKLKYKRSPIVKQVQALKLSQGLYGVPNYAKPGRFDEGYYVDIKSAYWSIMSIVGWDPDYFPGKWLSAGRPPLDFPFQNHKIARNCLVSAGIPGTMTQYIPRGEFVEVKPGNPLANLSLYKLIQDVLNSIAKQAIQAGAIYANTDGFITPDKKSAARVINIIYDWGLIPSIKAEGEGEVKSSGAYKVGGSVSIPFTKRDKAQGIRRIYAPNYDKWLFENFQYWGRENPLTD